MTPDQPSRGESGEPVLTTGFEYPADEPTETERQSDTEELLRHCMLVLVEGGHGDAIATRTAAFARMLGLYSSDAELAQKIGVNPATIARATKRLRGELKKRDLQIELLSNAKPAKGQ